MKSFRWTWVAIAAVLGLAVFTYRDFKNSKSESEGKEQALQVIQIPRDQVTKIEIIKRDSKLALEKSPEKNKDDKWRIIEPIQDLADQQAVTTFLLTFGNEKSQAVVAEGADIDLKAFGLTDPVARLKVTGSGGKTQELKIGSVRAYDSNLYAQSEGENKILLVSSSWDTHLAKLPKDFRDKHLLRQELKISDFKRIQLKSAGTGEFELVKNGETWTVAKGGPAFPVLTEKVTFYLDAVKGVRAQDFAEGEKASSLVKSAFELKLFTDKREPVLVARFSKPEEKKKEDHGHQHGQGAPPTVKASSSEYSEVLILTQSMLETLQKPPENFYDKRLPFKFESNEVGRVEVNAKELKGAFVKKGETWAPEDPGLQKEVDSAKLNDAIQKLASMEAVRVLDAKKGALGRSESTLKLLKSSGETLFELAWADTVTEKAQAGRPEARYLLARTNRTENRIGLPEKEVQALSLTSWLKTPGAPPEASPKPEGTPKRRETPPGSPRVGFRDEKGNGNVRNPSEVANPSRSGRRHSRFLASISLSQ